MTRIIDNVIEIEGALILGAGLAGLFTALKLAPYPVTVLAGTRPGVSGSSAWAQGGVAAAIGAGDSPALHASDTAAAGAGFCDLEIVEAVTGEAPARIEDLIVFGVPFDRDPTGALALGREAAHSSARIVHAGGDRSGAAITRTLAERALATPSIALLEGFHAVELAIENGSVRGLFARTGSGAAARLVLFRSNAVIFATGGAGALFAVTTNPPETRGEGLGMAARAGAQIADPEFVQFHPTAILADRDPAPLATEALRGRGAILIDETGRRFMPAVHDAAELAPRDVVARGIHREIAKGHRVFLDCRESVGARFATDFPTVFAACRAAGFDPSATPIPVAPAAHYHMGGIATDEKGRSSIPGLWALGECASTGLHGANRLASNSLLEATVFGARVAEDVRGQVPSKIRGSATPPPARFAGAPPPQRLREAMTRDVGLERDAAGLCRALGVISRLEQAGNGEPALLNMCATAKLIAAAALKRQESRGAHFRTDFPALAAPPERTRITLAEADAIASSNATLGQSNAALQ